jgi:carboxyl-terminal processing protease
MKQRWSMALIVVLVAFFTGGWLLRGMRDRNTLHGQPLLQTVLEYMSQYYVDSLPPDSLYDLAASGAVKQLHDPYSSLEVDEDYRALNEVTTGNYGGLGMQIDVRDGWITVVAPLPQTPAERAGIEAGDQIEEVNGTSTHGISQDKAVKLLRGDIGTKAVLRIRRPGTTALMTFPLVREKIHSRSTQPGVMLDDRTGYVALSTVSDSSARELRSEVDSLLTHGMKGLILDLRRNPGGLLTQGVAVSDMFLDPGRKIVETRGRMADMNHQFTDGAPQLWPALPVVVLVNEYTASAAEIIAGALQDNDRAVVVGNATFGKGLVQTFWSFGEGRGFKLTTGRWYTPSGRTIQRTAKSQDAQMELATAEANHTDHKWLDSLPNFHTASGRVVKGGGGIVPDRIVGVDTLTTGEQAFAKGLGTNVAAFRDALVAEALALKEKHGVTSPDFVVTPAMRQDLLARLAAKHVTLTPDQVAGGGRLLDQQLAYEIERYVFGRAFEIRRSTTDDAQVKAALLLLHDAPTTAALLAKVAGGPAAK